MGAAMSTPLATFSELLRQYRRLANLTQEELAERAGISTRSVSDLERGISRAPHTDTVQLLARAFGLTGQERDTFLAVAHPSPIPSVVSQTAPLELPPLPTALTSLIGREREEAGIVHLLQREDVRLLTLTGPAGVGKTRLALQVTRTLQQTFTDGAALIPLSTIREARLVIPTLAHTVGLRDSGSQHVLQTLMAALREKHLLLVLDNFEQVLGAATQVAELLAACPLLKVLVTSRAILRVRGEQEFMVSPLTLPDLAHLPPLSDLERYDAVALFLQRARAIKPDFHFTAAQAAPIAEICVRLDGLPLAIELAVARLKLLPPDALLARLAGSAGPTSLQVLIGGAHDLPERQQTLRSAIGWSYELLSVADQRLFRCLCGFVGGASLEAVAALEQSPNAPEMQILERLESLLDKSLVQQVSTGEPRFGLLETIREYGIEQLVATGEEVEMRARHADYFLTMVERAAQEFLGVGQAQASARISLEYDNVRAALQWGLAHTQIERGLQIVGALWRFWYGQGYLSEGREWLGAFLARAEADSTVSKLTQARALYGAGILAAEQGDYVRAGALAEQCALLAQEVDEKTVSARALNLRGNIAKYQGDFGQATLNFEAGLALFREIDEKNGIATMLNNLATIAQERGQYTQATKLQAESLALKRAQQDQRGVAVALMNLADMARDQGDLSQALAFGGESLALFQQLDDKKGMAFALNNLSEAALLQGEYGRASAWGKESLALSQKMGDQWTLAVALHNAGALAWARGDTQEARDAYQESLQFYQRERSQLGVVECLEGLAETFVQTDPERTARLYGLTTAWRTLTGVPLPPADGAAHDKVIASISASLGEASFAQATAAGQATPLEGWHTQYVVQSADGFPD